MEYLDKKGNKIDASPSGIPGFHMRVPIQQNFSDCGVYLLHYVEKILLEINGGILEKLANKENIEDWFTEEDINRKRHQIWELIDNLANDYENYTKTKPVSVNNFETQSDDIVEIQTRQEKKDVEKESETNEDMNFENITKDEEMEKKDDDIDTDENKKNGDTCLVEVKKIKK